MPFPSGHARSRRCQHGDGRARLPRATRIQVSTVASDVAPTEKAGSLMARHSLDAGAGEVIVDLCQHPRPKEGDECPRELDGVGLAKPANKLVPEKRSGVEALEPWILGKLRWHRPRIQQQTVRYQTVAEVVERRRNA